MPILTRVDVMPGGLSLGGGGMDRVIAGRRPRAYFRLGSKLATIFPARQTRTVPSDWLTVNAMDFVLDVMPAAAACRAPSPDGSPSERPAFRCAPRLAAVEARYRNPKLTTPADLALVEALLVDTF